MTIQQLIDELQKIEHKNRLFYLTSGVFIYDFSDIKESQNCDLPEKPLTYSFFIKSK